MTGQPLDRRGGEDHEAESFFNPQSGNEYLQRESGWVAWVEFAGLMLVLLGGFHVIQGLVAVFRDEVFVVTQQRLVLSFDYTAWGWIHIIAGAALVLVGVGLFSGRPVARILGVAAAFLSALLNVAFLPAYPVWSTMMIAIDVLVIWAITVHGGELRRQRP
jgi:hypothetical protein